MSVETVRELVPATPPATVAGLTLAGVQLADWALLITILYTIMMAIVLLPKFINTIKGLVDYVTRKRK